MAIGYVAVVVTL